jgi:hypothetical protein
MARSKAPRKRKPAPSSRRSRPDYPKRFLASLPPDNDDDDIVAMANKLAQTVWAVAAHCDKYDKNHVSIRPY